MLRSLKALRGYTVRAKDDDIGKVHDFYFHDDTWTVRYLVIETGHWLPGRKVLVATHALGKPNWSGFAFPVALTREQVEKSPEVDTDKPVSRQQEDALHKHFGWPLYWVDPGIGAWPGSSPMVPVFDCPEEKEAAAHEKADTRLRSAKEITGYRILASDGALGHVEDLITDDVHWIIRYLVVHMGKVLPAKKVLVSPQWLKEISYPNRQVSVSLTRQKILDCPEFYPGAGVNREYEARIYDYYGRPTYWEDEVPVAKTD